MWPFATVRQKALLPVTNQPCIRLVVISLQGIGVQSILVAGDAGAIGAPFAPLDSSQVHVARLPACDALEAILAGWERLGGDNDLMIVPGDVFVTDQDLKRLLGTFFDDDAEAAVLLVPLGKENPNRWICAEEHDGSLISIAGHPRSGTNRWTGICVFRPHLKRWIENAPNHLFSVPVGGMPPLERDLSVAVAFMLETGVQVRAVVAQEVFVDLDKPWHILEANSLAAEAEFASLERDDVHGTAVIADSASIEGRVRLEEGATIGSGVRILGNAWLGREAVVDNGAILEGNVVVGAHSRVRNYCQLANAVVGPDCIIDHAAEFSGVLFGGVYLYHYCHIYGVLGAKVDIGAATVCGTLRFDDDQTVHSIAGAKEIPPIGANATYIGDYSRTGVNVICMPGVKVGSYSCVGPGVVVYDDIPDRTLVTVKQELAHRPWGPERYGW